MSTVTFSVSVRKAALLPNVEVDVGLDMNDDRSFTHSEIRAAAQLPSGRYQAAFEVAATTDLRWAVIIRGPAGSMYSIDAEAGGRPVLEATVHGSVLGNDRGGSIGSLL